MQALNNIVKFVRVPVPANNIVPFRGFGILENQLGFCPLPEASPVVQSADSPIYCDGCESDRSTLSLDIYFDLEFAQQIVNQINKYFPDAIAFNESNNYCGVVHVECLTPATFWAIVSRIEQA